MSLQITPLKNRIPSTKEILRRALMYTLKQYKASSLNELVERGVNPSEIIVKLERKAHEIYLSEERKALREYLIDRGISPGEVDKIVDIIVQEQDLTKEISNIRRARAGITSELILIEVLRAHGIPCERGKRKIKGYRPDIVVPSYRLLEEDINKAVPIAIKRTLRERWAEDIDVFKFPHGVFVLLTPDPDFNEDKLKDMIRRGMKRIYIPDELYNRSPFVQRYSQVRRLSTLLMELKKFLQTSL